MSEIISFSPSPSLFGFGALNKLSETLENRGYRRVLIFTDSQIVESGILQRVLDLLKERIEFDVFDRVPPEPHSSDMDRQKESFESDFHALLAIGGEPAVRRLVDLGEDATEDVRQWPMAVPGVPEVRQPTGGRGQQRVEVAR